MLRLSPAKINLTLRVLGTRADGFHELDSLVLPIGLCDEVSLTRAECTTLEVVADQVDLRALPADPEQNLALRALRLLERTAQRSLPTRIAIRKRIPLGGGLGGGSSNAAAVLCAANALWQLSLSQTQLCTLGAQLGSDVALFVLDGLVRMRGRGERVERLTPPAPPPEIASEDGLWVVLASDLTHCATPEVYRAFDRLTAAPRPERLADSAAGACACAPAPLFSRPAAPPPAPPHASMQERLTETPALWDNRHLSLWKGEVEPVADWVGNDLQAACFALFPSVAKTAEALRSAGCQGVTLCGSGATVFGLVQGRAQGESALAHPALAGCWRACVQALPDGVMAAHGPLTPIVMVRIHVGQPSGCR